MYHQFNIQQFYVLPTHCIYVFCVDLRTNSDYFPIQHKLTVFITDTHRVYCNPSVQTAILFLPLYTRNACLQLSPTVRPLTDIQLLFTSYAKI